MAFFALLIVLVLFVFPFYVLGQLSAQKEEVRMLRVRLDRLEKRGVAPSEMEASVAPEPATTQVVPVVQEREAEMSSAQLAARPPVPLSALFQSTTVPPAPVPAPSHQGQAGLDSIKVATATMAPAEPTWWTSQSILTKVGAVLVLISIGSFLGYAIVSGWIGPVAQVLLAFVVGIGVLAFGALSLGEHRQRGSLFTALGTGIVLLASLVAVHVYELVPPAMGGLMMWLPVVVMTYMSILYRYEAMAVFGLLLAMFVPALVDTSYSGLNICMYLGIVCFGALLVAMTIGSRVLVPTSVVITALWTLSFANDSDNYTTFIAINGLMLLFTVANMITVTHERENKYSSYVTTAAVSGLWLLAWIGSVAPEAAGVPLYLIWSVLFIFGAYVVGRMTQHHMVPRVYVGVSVIYLTFATLYLFDGMLLVFVALAEVTTLVLTYLLGLRDRLFAGRLLWTYSFPLLLSLPFLFSERWLDEPFSFHEPFFVVVVVGVVMLSVGRLFAWSAALREQKTSMLAAYTLYTIGGFYLNMLLALSLPLHLLVVVWLCEVGCLALYNLRVLAATARAKWFLVGYIVPVSLAVSFLAKPEWQSGVIHIPFFVILTTVVVLFAIATQFAMHGRDSDDVVPEIFYSVGTFFSAAFIWLVLHAALPLGIATMAALIIYTAVGLVLYVGGIRTYDNFAKVLGLVGIGGVVARLLLVEVWELSVPLRIIAFMVIGLMLLSTAFITKGKRQSEQQQHSNEAAGQTPQE